MTQRYDQSVKDKGKGKSAFKQLYQSKKGEVVEKPSPLPMIARSERRMCEIGKWANLLLTQHLFFVSVRSNLTEELREIFWIVCRGHKQDIDFSEVKEQTLEGFK